MNAPSPLRFENAVERDVAVIDVGSNSVRLVHYRVEGRAVWPVFNEKVMAGLGEGVRQTGQLNPEGRKIALAALKRFQRILHARGVSECRVVATAAVRNAQDGPEFVAQAGVHTGIAVEVLSGEEEGRFSAMGLVSGFAQAEGLMGDLGGSSLELALIRKGIPEPALTFALGPQEAMPQPFDIEAGRAAIRSRFEGSPFAAAPVDCFYAIGGAWRNLVHLSFARSNPSLKVVNGFTLGRDAALELAQFAAHLSPDSLMGVPGVSRRRIRSLPWAALLLEELVTMSGAEKVVFSAYGLREGVLMSTLPEAVRGQDPLLAGVDAMARQVSPRIAFGPALAEWIAPVFADMPVPFEASRQDILLEAACRLVDAGARLHPDHRIDLVRDSILYAPLGGISHAERTYLAGVLHFRYAGRRRDIEETVISHFLSAEQIAHAQILGMTIRMMAKLSGRSDELLSLFKLSFGDGDIRLEIDESVHDLYVERSVSLLDKLAELTGNSAWVRYV